VRGLGKYLRGLGLSVKVTSEPTNGPVGQVIKRYLRTARERDPIYEALAFAADRRWHCEKIIRPALISGSVVICDRYLYSSLAYQAAAGLEERWILEINKFAIKPDVAFFLDAPPAVCKMRLARRRPSILERDDAQEAAYAAYIDLVRRGLLIRIDATEERKAVLKRAVEVLRSRQIIT
jgi:dTMP kinase